METLHDFRENFPPHGESLVVKPELRTLSRKPGFLRWEDGGERMRELYVNGSGHFEPSLLSDFGLACYLGEHELVQQMVLSGTAPDICGHETAYQHGYLTLVVAGRQQFLKAPLSTKHVETARFLIQSGAPTEQQDIAWYTPLQHATIRGGPQLDVARVLLENGANPNNQNKYGCTSLMEACLTGSLKSLDLLLEFGADPEIMDADGCQPSVFHLQAGPDVSAIFMKWERRRAGAAPAPKEEKRCDACQKKPESGVVLRVCKRCRTAWYCNAGCQERHWQVHKSTCIPFDSTTCVTMVPDYANIGNLVSMSAFIRQGIGLPNSTKTKQGSTGAAWPPRRALPKQLVIKVQLQGFYPGDDANSGTSAASALRSNACLVYTKKRDLVCRLTREQNRQTWDRLMRVIKEKGVAGVKAYFTAEMASKNKLIIKLDDVLAVQPF